MTLSLDQLLALPDDAVIEPREVIKVLRISMSTFCLRRRHGEFPVREILPRLDRKPRWRLGDVRAFVRGEYQHREQRRRSAA